MAIPTRLLELVHLQAGSQVDIDVRQGRLIVVPQKKKRYKLADLLAQCNPALPITSEEQEWLDGGDFVEAVGSDLLEEVLARLQPIFGSGSLG